MNRTSNQTTNQGKFIVFEGSDGSGKHTQAGLLFKNLKIKITEIELLSFPQYDTPFGSLVAKYLRGEYGSLDELPPEIPCLLYALDRFQVKDKLASGIASGKWYIADRYTQSNLGHQGAKLVGKERDKLISWVESLESRLAQPDLVIYLHVPTSITQKLMEKREHKKYLESDMTQDIHELDQDYQQRVIDTYLELANDRANWLVITCVDQNTNNLRTIDEIHKEIVDKVNERFSL